MEEGHESSTPISHPFRWFPEFLGILHKRSRTQARLLALAMLVGIVAGLGAVAFSLACQAVLRIGLDGVAGYRAHGPNFEARVSWIPESNRSSAPGCCCSSRPSAG